MQFRKIAKTIKKRDPHIYGIFHLHRGYIICSEMSAELKWTILKLL